MQNSTRCFGFSSFPLYLGGGCTCILMNFDNYMGRSAIPVLSSLSRLKYLSVGIVLPESFGTDGTYFCPYVVVAGFFFLFFFFVCCSCDGRELRLFYLRALLTPKRRSRILQAEFCLDPLPNIYRAKTKHPGRKVKSARVIFICLFFYSVPADCYTVI